MATAPKAEPIPYISPNNGQLVNTVPPVLASKLSGNPNIPKHSTQEQEDVLIRPVAGQESSPATALFLYEAY